MMNASFLCVLIVCRAAVDSLLADHLQRIEATHQRPACNVHISLTYQVTMIDVQRIGKDCSLQAYKWRRQAGFFVGARKAQMRTQKTFSHSEEELE